MFLAVKQSMVGSLIDFDCIRVEVGPMGFILEPLVALLASPSSIGSFEGLASKSSKACIDVAEDIKDT
jgi:hypothetical protein